MPLFDSNIYFGNPLMQFNAHRDEILEAIEGVCSSGMHVLGPVVETFEKEFAAWSGAKYAVGVGSGTDALKLALSGFDIGAGDEVITVSHTALATASAIISSGAKPVLVDVNKKTCTIDITKLEDAVTSKTKAIIPVHLYGFPCDMDAIIVFAKKHNLIVIEDCAQAHGATYHGKKVGTLGDAGCFSFYPTKNLGAVGDGGAVITNNEKAADNIRKMREYGWDNKRIAHVHSGVSRLDALQAAILSVKIKYLEEYIERRRAIAASYDKLINWDKFTRPVTPPDTNPAYHLYVIMTDRRAEIIDKFKEENVFLGIHYEHPVHKHPGYSPFISTPKNSLAITDDLSNSVLSLPIYPELPLSSVEKIAGFLNEL